MKIKTDENLGASCVAILRDAGHDVHTVVDEGLAGAPDPRVLDQCRTEGRTLVTLDVEFANPLLYPPASHRGVVLLRMKRQMVLSELHEIVRTLARGLEHGSPDGQIWIVQRDRIRVYQPE